MDDKIEFACSKCAQKVKIPSLKYIKFDCPNCKEQFIIDGRVKNFTEEETSEIESINPEVEKKDENSWGCWFSSLIIVIDVYAFFPKYFTKDAAIELFQKILSNRPKTETQPIKIRPKMQISEAKSDHIWDLENILIFYKKDEEGDRINFDFKKFNSVNYTDALMLFDEKI